MADNKAKRWGPDRTRVNLHESYEVAYWGMKWDVTEKQLKDAVAQVGPMVEDVARALGRTVHGRPSSTP
jgi:Protein of unknown function (DUF3606)